MQVEPFAIAISDAILRERLARTRFPDEIVDSGWTYGTNLAYLRAIVAYWREQYDWRAAQAALTGATAGATSSGASPRTSSSPT